MAPDVSGRIVELDVRDNEAVHKGDVLFRIDPDPYRMRVDQARAAVRSLEAKLALTADQVAAQTSKADAAASGIDTAEAQRVLATSTLARMEPLLGRGFVTAQQVDQARTARRTAQLGLQQARLQADEARQAITNTKPTKAELEGARATLALAERDLNKTVVRAPCEGRITALDIAAGEFAATGHPLFTIIDTEQWYAIGNFSRDRPRGNRAGAARNGLCDGATKAPVARRGRQPGLGCRLGCERHVWRPPTCRAYPQLGADRGPLPGTRPTRCAARQLDALWCDRGNRDR
jgi:multidrug efflux system membrane fusion protein